MSCDDTGQTKATAAAAGTIERDRSGPVPEIDKDGPSF